MTQMSTTIQVGMTITVPAGADFARKTPYRLMITELAGRTGNMICVHGDRLRADGTQSRRKSVRMFAVLDADKISEA